MAVGMKLSLNAQPVPVAESLYRESLIKLMRAHDSFGVWAKKSDEEVLLGFVLSKEQRRAIPTVGDPDSKVLWRLDVFYTAISYAVTRRTEIDATPVVKISNEGFGRAFVIAGRLVLLSRVLRDVHRFGFESTDALAAAGDAMVDECLNMIDRYPDVANEASWSPR